MVSLSRTTNHDPITASVVRLLRDILSYMLGIPSVRVEHVGYNYIGSKKSNGEVPIDQSLYRC